MKMNLQAICSDRFTYNPVTKTFVIEDSDLNGFNVRQPIYDDACDVGFDVVSSKTGVKVTYYFDLAEQGVADNEVLGWWFSPTFESLWKVPTCRGTKVFVIND